MSLIINGLLNCIFGNICNIFCSKEQISDTPTKSLSEPHDPPLLFRVCLANAEIKKKILSTHKQCTFLNMHLRAAFHDSRIVPDVASVFM
jgi:hypothetical protein